MNLENVSQTGQCLQVACPDKSPSSAVHVLLYVFAAAVVLITVFGNLLVIISVCHFKQLHTPTNILILSLAAADVVVGVIVLPWHFIWLIESCWLFGSTICQIFHFFSYHLTSVSVHNVVLIAIDRYFALKNPFLYSEKVSSDMVWGVVMFNWAFSLLYNFALLYLNGNFTDLHMCPGECLYAQDEVSYLIDFLIVFIFPCTVIIVLYFSIFLIAKKHANAITALKRQNITGNGKNINGPMKSERKAAKVLSILISVFLVCLVPCYICTLLTNVKGYETFYTVINQVLVLLYLNSSINPIIYALFYPCFRRSIKLILTCKIFRSNSSLLNVLGAR